jgi:hypothetical protein
MPVKPSSKYDLRELHQEIDYFDRKIAYCQSYEKFDSEEARAAALRKLETKRLSLVKKAMDAVKVGIECDPKYLPRSLRNTAAIKAEL